MPPPPLDKAASGKQLRNDHPGIPTVLGSNGLNGSPALLGPAMAKLSNTWEVPAATS